MELVLSTSTTPPPPPPLRPFPPPPPNAPTPEATTSLLHHAEMLLNHQFIFVPRTKRFTPKKITSQTSKTKQFLHQRTFAPKAHVYRTSPRHQKPFIMPDAFYTKNAFTPPPLINVQTRNKPFVPFQKSFTPGAFYSKRSLHQQTFEIGKLDRSRSRLHYTPFML